MLTITLRGIRITINHLFYEYDITLFRTMVKPLLQQDTIVDICRMFKSHNKWKETRQKINYRTKRLVSI